jgi:hypothetical protein
MEVTEELHQTTKQPERQKDTEKREKEKREKERSKII